MQVFTDDDADLSVVQQRNVAVIGEGAAACVHGMCLRDSGVDVRVGLATGSPYRVDIEAAGLPVLPPYDACEEADLIVLLSPEPGLPQLYADAVEPNLVKGDALLVDRGFELRFGLVAPPGDVDVVMVAAEEPADVLREQFEAGRGVPVLVAVERDASGAAWGLALSYARAIGGTRTAAIATTVAEQAETAVFAEQVLWPGLTKLVQRGFGALVAAGYSPDLAYLRCVRDLPRVVDLLTAEHGGTATFDVGQDGGAGGLLDVDPSAADRMVEVLGRIRDGFFDGADSAEETASPPEAARRDYDRKLLEDSGRALRELFGPPNSSVRYQ